jgi:hypothetical protein
MNLSVQILLAIVGATLGRAEVAVTIKTPMPPPA